MVDKLVVLSSIINRGFATIAMENGMPAVKYKRCIDLRSTVLKLPVRLFYQGRHNQIHKAELIGVASLGLPQTREIVKSIFRDLKQVRIYRVDLCVDLLGFTPWFFVVNTRLPRHQNFALYRSRGAVSFYLQFSRQHKIQFYDRLKYLRKTKSPLADIFRSDDQLTRVEVQLMGTAVPFKRFGDIHRYAEIEPQKYLRFRKLLCDSTEYTPVKRLATYGLRWLVSRFGLQATSRMFSSPEWGALSKTYLKEIQEVEIPRIRLLMRKSVRRWLEGRIYFPRATRGGRLKRNDHGSPTILASRKYINNSIY